MADLWSGLDTTLETQALAFLGEDGDYTTLQIQSVLVDTVYNLDRIMKANELPCLLIMSIEATANSGAHGGGVIHLEFTNSYTLVAVCKSASKREAQADGKELARRLSAFLTNSAVAQAIHETAGDNGETVQYIDYDNSRAGVQIFGRADRDEGDYVAVAGLTFAIATGV